MSNAGEFSEVYESKKRGRKKKQTNLTTLPGDFKQYKITL
jgi:hypothetical protein